MKLNLKPREYKLPQGPTFTMKPLSSGAYLEWLDCTMRYGVKPDATEEEKTQAGLRIVVNKDAQEVLARIIRDHFIQQTGIDADRPDGTSSAATIEEILGSSEARPLCLGLISQMMKDASLTEADLGNSAAPRAAS